MTDTTILNQLIMSYKEMANGRPYQSRDLAKGIEGYEESPPYFWTRHMLRSGRLCFANIVLPEDVRGQGIFTRLLEYVEANPYSFTGVEVEQVFEPRLQDYLKRLGWKDDLKDRLTAQRSLIKSIELRSVENGKAIPDELRNLLEEGPRALTLWKDFNGNQKCLK